MDLLCLMFESPRRGYLQMNTGKPMNAEQIARVAGCSTDEVSRLLAELDNAGVFSRAGTDGTIFSRRIVRDQQEREGAAERQQRKRDRESRGCHAAVTPPSQRSSSSSSPSGKTETGNAGASERGDPTEAVWTALEAWAVADTSRRGKGIDAAHGERRPLTMAISSWGQEPPYPGGVVWSDAVVRCCRAAMAGGTKFGDSPAYAIRVVNGLLASWRQGQPPEAAPGTVSVRVGDIADKAADDMAINAAVQAGIERAAARKARTA